MKLALQLYTLRDLIHSGSDLINILKDVKEIGFDGVEFAGYQDLDAETLKKALDDAGLAAVGTHMGLENYDEEHLDATLKYGKTLGLTKMGMGGADVFTRDGLEHFKKIIAPAAKKAEKEGIKIYYHNHDREFAPVDENSDKLIIDEVAQVCSLQIDTYWSFYAGVDNHKFLTEHKDSIVHIHIKDGLDGHPKALTEGNCDLDTVVKTVKEIGLDWVILENDNPEPDGLSDIKRSMEFLKANFR
ncbi:MAG: sugar phosphate isomerase/epimerase [Oscillospiraceae bacterium]|nr:sugar phosphate isomerase/epimerase [Oscillospiraceae bacterium]